MVKAIKQRAVVAIAIVVSFVLITSLPAWTQTLAEAARQERERKKQSAGREQHVYTNEDLTKTQILMPEDQARVLARKTESSPASAVEASLPNLPPPSLAPATAQERTTAALSGESRSSELSPAATPAPLMGPVAPSPESAAVLSARVPLPKPSTPEDDSARQATVQAAVLVAPETPSRPSPAPIKKSVAKTVSTHFPQAPAPIIAAPVAHEARTGASSAMFLPRSPSPNTVHTAESTRVVLVATPADPAHPDSAAAGRLPVAPAIPFLAKQTIALSPVVIEHRLTEQSVPTAASAKKIEQKTGPVFQQVRLSACEQPCGSPKRAPLTIEALSKTPGINHPIIKSAVETHTVRQTTSAPTANLAYVAPALAAARSETCSTPCTSTKNVRLIALTQTTPSALQAEPPESIASLNTPLVSARALSKSLVGQERKETEPMTGMVNQAGTGVQVQRGDSLWKLALRYLGNGKRWRELAKSNPRLTDPGLIRPGDWVQVPAQGPQNTERVVVQPGDTLWSVAETALGSHRAFSCIAHANPQIQSANVIRPGQTLVVPEACAVDR